MNVLFIIIIYYGLLFLFIIIIMTLEEIQLINADCCSLMLQFLSLITRHLCGVTITLTIYSTSLLL